MTKGVRRFAVAAAVLLVGCGNEDSVSLSGRIDAAELTVDQTAVGSFLTGHFELVVALGAHASEPVTVQTTTFTLAAADTGVELGLGPLAVTTTETFPLAVDAGDERSVAFVLDATASPLETGAVDTLCASPVALVGAVAHSLHGGTTTTVRSAPVTVVGCP